MGGHALTPPTDRRLGRPLPYQLANQTHAHLYPPKLSSISDATHRSYAGFFTVSNVYPPDKGRLRTRYSPVRHSSASEDLLPFDLHVLGLPLAFILSQDQTLRSSWLFIYSKVFCFRYSLPLLIFLSWQFFSFANSQTRSFNELYLYQSIIFLS